MYNRQVTAAVPGFLPSTRGFRFTDSFPPGPAVRVRLTGPERADDVVIRFDAGHPDRPTPITHTISIAQAELHGFFRVRYTARRPPDQA